MKRFGQFLAEVHVTDERIVFLPKEAPRTPVYKNPSKSELKEYYSFAAKAEREHGGGWYFDPRDRTAAVRFAWCSKRNEMWVWCSALLHYDSDFLPFDPYSPGNFGGVGEVDADGRMSYVDASFRDLTDDEMYADDDLMAFVEMAEKQAGFLKWFANPQKLKKEMADVAATIKKQKGW